MRTVLTNGKMVSTIRKATIIAAVITVKTNCDNNVTASMKKIISPHV